MTVSVIKRRECVACKRPMCRHGALRADLRPEGHFYISIDYVPVDGVRDALGVITQDANIRALLSEHDPKALAQADIAFAELPAKTAT